MASLAVSKVVLRPAMASAVHLISDRSTRALDNPVRLPQDRQGVAALHLLSVFRAQSHLPAFLCLW
jgi:hypothetical protein